MLFATLLLHFWCYTFFASLHYTLVHFFATPFAILCYNFVQQFYTFVLHKFVSILLYNSTHFATLTGLAIVVYLTGKIVQFLQSVQVCGLYAKTTVLLMQDYQVANITSSLLNFCTSLLWNQKKLGSDVLDHFWKQLGACDEKLKENSKSNTLIPIVQYTHFHLS